MFLIAVLVVGGFAIYVMTPEERRRALSVVTQRTSTFGRAIAVNLEACTPWLEALRARAGQPYLALGIAIVYAAAFSGLVSGAGDPANADTLVRWGATFGPRTANGEWWRLLTALFLHRNIFSLAIDVLAILQLGFALERVYGRVAFGCVFAAAGILANTVHLATHPVAVRTGASGALYGLYGLLIVWAVQGARAPSELTIPRAAYRLLVPVAGLFLLTSMLSDSGGLMANVAALAVGLVSGVAIAGAIQENSTAPARIGAIAGSTAVVVVLMAVPSIGTTDVRPEIAHVLDLEARTAAPYAKAVGQFKLGAASTDALATLIDRQILPELRETQTRLDQLRGVPPEHRALLQDAQRYVRLRTESWDLRARALHSSSMRALRLADAKERESLDAFDQLKAEDGR